MYFKSVFYYKKISNYLFFIIFYDFDVLKKLKNIKKIYFNIFLNKKYFKITSSNTILNRLQYVE
jgi:hypothetical protein